jgi:hypothetical protein
MKYSYDGNVQDMRQRNPLDNGQTAMKRRLPAAVNMIAELVFIVSVILIIIGAVFDTFVSNPLLSVLSVVAFCLSIFSWAYLQDN